MLMKPNCMFTYLCSGIYRLVIVSNNASTPLNVLTKKSAKLRLISSSHYVLWVAIKRDKFCISDIQNKQTDTRYDSQNRTCEKDPIMQFA